MASEEELIVTFQHEALSCVFVAMISSVVLASTSVLEPYSISFFKILELSVLPAFVILFTVGLSTSLTRLTWAIAGIPVGYLAGLGLLALGLPSITYLTIALLTALYFLIKRRPNEDWRTRFFQAATALSLPLAGTVNTFHIPAWEKAYVQIGFINLDTLFHSALANITRTYGVVSTGADGMGEFTYHFASHLVMGGAAEATSVSSIELYSIGAPLILPPLLLFGVRLCVSAVKSHFKLSYPDWLDWGLTWVLVAGVIPARYVLPAIGAQYAPFLSESYGFAISIMLVTSASLVPKLFEFSNHRAERLRFLVVFSVCILSAGFFKVSIPFVVLPTLGFVLLRTHKHWGSKAIICFAFLSLALLTGIYILVGAKMGHGRGLNPMLPFLKFKENPSLLLSFPWLVLVVGLVLAKSNASIGELKKGSLVGIEALLVMAILGMAPGWLIYISGSSEIYFSDIVKWVSAPVGIALFSAAFPRSVKSGRAIVIGLFLFQISLHALANSIRFVSEEVKFTRCVEGDEHRCKELNIPTDRGHSAERASLIRALEDIRTQTPRTSAVFVASDSVFWDQPALQHWHSSAVTPPLLIPGIAQRVGVGALARLEITTGYYGYIGLQEAPSGVDTEFDALQWTCKEGLTGLTILTELEGEFSWHYRECLPLSRRSTIAALTQDRPASTWKAQE